VRSLRLAGLETDACGQLLEQWETSSTEEERARLVALYAGNPLALKIVAETIAELFNGEIGAFLEQGEVIFSNIRDLLEVQFNRLTPLEQAVLIWLAIVREPLALDHLLTLFVFPADKELIKEVLAALQRHSLVERGRQQDTYSLQSVVQQYVIETLIERCCEQIQRGTLDDLISYALEQTTVKEYVRQAQTRLIIAPIILRLRSMYQRADAIERQLWHLLDLLRAQTKVGGSPEVQGYGPANVIALLHELRGHLRHLDLSQLFIRGAYLQGIEMQDTSLVGAIVCDTLFTEAFNVAWTVAISSHGKYWAAGSRQGEVRIWREEGRLLHLMWQAHTDNVYSLAFSPDERMLATASWDGTIKLWNLACGTLLWTGPHTNSVNSVAFAPDGRLIASGGDAGVVKLWDVATGTLLQAVTTESGAIYKLAWSADGSMLASGHFGGILRVWQVQGTLPPACIHVLTGHTNYVFDVAFAPDGRTLASGSWDGTVKLWDVASGQLRQTLKGHTGWVWSVVWSADGCMIASASSDGTIRLWDVKQDVKQACCRAILYGHTSIIHCIAFTPDSRRLLSGSEDGTLRVWDIDNGQCVRIMQGYAVSFYDVSWNPIDQRLASAGTDGNVIIWDMHGEAQPRVLHGHTWIVHGVAWSPDGRLLASSGWDNAIRLWKPTTGTCFQILRDPGCLDTIFQGIAWSPDGHLLASGSYLHGVQVWDMMQRTRRWVGSYPATKIRCVEWSPDGSRLASCGDDGSLCLWRASDGELLACWRKHRSAAVCVAWSPDGKRLASGGSGKVGGELFVWDAGSGEIIQRLQMHKNSVFALAWSPNGEVLISGGRNGCLYWWEVSSGKCLMTRREHWGTVQSLRVSPDGKMVASSGDDSTIRLWKIESAELVRTLRRDRPYERLDITGIKGLTDAQKATLHALGAFSTGADKP
jgi:WD40 repeat protein